MFPIDGAPVFDTEGPRKQRRIVGGPRPGDSLKALAEHEWSPDVRMFPTWVDFEFFSQTEPDLHCRIELRGDAPRLVEFGWRSRSEAQHDIRQKHLRSVTVDRIAQIVYSVWIVELRDVSRDGAEATKWTDLSAEQEREIYGVLQDLRSGRRHVDAELLRQVADIYRENFDSAPAEAVARAFGVKPRMAHEYVKKARDRGFLPPTTQGKKKI